MRDVPASTRVKAPETLAADRFRVWAVVCAVAFLGCELLSRPFAEMGVCDDWSYVRTAQILAQTGHLVYNGWASAMIGWQLYAAAAFMKVLGPTFTAARMSTLAVGTVTAFLMQRVFVRLGLSERNAALGTLAVVLTPMYMLLAASFMSDVQGVFAIVVCLYGCVRAMQSGTERGTARRTIGWLCFAGAANAFFGTSRQIAWLGVLVMVPATAWALRGRPRVLVTGLLVWVAGGAFIAGCMHWFKLQPYSIPESALVKISGLHQVVYMVRQLTRGALEVPFLVLAVLIAFLPEVRRNGRGFVALLGVTGLGYLLLAVAMARHHGPGMMLQPLLGDWLSPSGFYGAELSSPGPVALGTGIRAVLTAVSMVGLLCVGAFLLRLRRSEAVVETDDASRISWMQIAYLLGPFTLAYCTLLIPRSASNLLDRYLLPLMVVAVVCLVRAYQDFVRPTLPVATVVTIALIAVFSIAGTHDMFALYRARVTLANEVAAAGIPDNALDGGFEYNGWVELERGGHINDDRLINPPHSFVPVDPYRGWTCSVKKDTSPGLLHFMPQYGIAFNPDACHGPAGIAPVSYFRWLGMRTATLYVVKYGPF